MIGKMDTLTDRMQQLRATGWVEELSIVDGAVTCDACGCASEPEEVVVDEVYRFEGASDPGDQSILFAITMPCDHRGALPASYGKDTAPDISRALKRLDLSHD